MLVTDRDANMSIDSRPVTVIAMNQSKSHLCIPSWLRLQKHFMTWKADAVDWKPGMDYRDLIAGYIEDFEGMAPEHLLKDVDTNPVGYDPDALEDIRPEFDVSLVMNRGMPVGEWLRNEQVQDELKAHNIEHKLAEELGERVSAEYEAGRKVCGLQAFSGFVHEVNGLPEQLAALTVGQRKWVRDIVLYCGINESLYRQTVVKWLCDIGADFRIAGLGWGWLGEKRHIGYIDEPLQIRQFYQLGRLGMSLNSHERPHHRIWEIACAGRPCITRGRGEGIPENEFSHHAFNRYLEGKIDRLLRYVESDYQEPFEEDPEEFKYHHVPGFDSREELKELISHVASNH
jgi:hypothetical protein